MLDTSGGQTIIIFLLASGLILFAWGYALWNPSWASFSVAAVLTLIIAGLIAVFGD